jgi:hypothetical protein
MTRRDAGDRAVQPGDREFAPARCEPDTPTTSSSNHRMRPHRGVYHRFIEANPIAR